MFLDSKVYVSGAALMKAVLANPSFVNVIGEFGHTLKRIAENRNSDTNIQQLRAVITNLYQKSGAASEAGGLGYSDTTQNVESVSGVAYSMIGETTPAKFYESLNPSVMEDGFLSRFTIIECPKDRPELVEEPVTDPDESMLSYLCGICSQSLQLIAKNNVEMVVEDSAAKTLFQNFNKECRTNINASEEDSQRQMWNRAHLKAKRMAALFAVADNPFSPTITFEHAQYAINLVYRDISIMGRHIITGDVGTGDDARERKILSVMSSYLSRPYEGNDDKVKVLHDDGLVTRAYIQQCTNNIKSFRDHPMQSSAALTIAIKSLEENGHIKEFDKMKLNVKYGFTGKCYQLIKLPEVVNKTKLKMV